MWGQGQGEACDKVPLSQKQICLILRIRVMVGFIEDEGWKGASAGSNLGLKFDGASSSIKACFFSAGMDPPCQVFLWGHRNC